MSAVSYAEADYLVERMNVLLNGVEMYLGRKEAEIPDNFVPSAREIAVGTLQFLWYVGRKVSYDARHRSPRWSGGIRKGLFETITDEGLLIVRRYGSLWSIEHKYQSVRPKGPDILAVNGCPVFFRDCKEAMALAKHCWPNPPGNSQHYLAWVPRDEP